MVFFSFLFLLHLYRRSYSFYFKTNSILITLSFFLTNILFCYSLSGLIIIAYSFVLKNFTGKPFHSECNSDYIFILYFIQHLFLQDTALSERIFRKDRHNSEWICKISAADFYSESVYAPAIFILCFVATGFVFMLLYWDCCG